MTIMQHNAGRDVFPDNTFDDEAWSAPHLYTLEDVYNTFNQLNIVGRKIQSMRAVGGDYKIFYEVLDYPDKFDDNELVQCIAQLDEPLILTLDNGDNIELFFPSEGDFMISRNCFPADLKHSVIPNDFDASQLFSMCLNHEIIGVDVGTTQFTPVFFDKFPDQTQSIFIKNITLRFQNIYDLRFYGDLDYFSIDVRDDIDNIHEIAVNEYKKCLNMDRYKEQIEIQKERERKKWTDFSTKL
jgi:hypothetical protein